MAPRSCDSSTHASSSSGLMPLEAAISFGREHCAGGTGANYEDRIKVYFCSARLASITRTIDEYRASFEHRE